MSKLQWIVLLSALVLLVLLYFGCPTKPPGRTAIDERRVEKATTIDIDKLLERATKRYPREALRPILVLEKSLADTTNAVDPTENMKAISSSWNQLGDFALGGMYAEKVAETTQTDSAWSIAGTTYFSCFRRDQDSLIRDFCISKSIKAFESAISIAPDEPVHSVNLGLCYVEGGGNPMKGILIIRDIAEKYPENKLASMTLGRMSVRTGQYDKAIQRFENILKYHPGDAETHYLLGVTYQALNNTPKTAFHFSKFVDNTNDEARKNEVKTILKSLKSN
mgnify:FL=1